MKSFACLFDIDGVLTLPITDQRKISIIDPHIIEILHNFHQQDIKFSLITGRAFGWVEKFLLHDYRSFLHDIPIFTEYGLASFISNKLKVSKKAKEFRDEFFFPIMSSIKQICQEKNLFFEMKAFVDYPDHGSLWLEEKKGMISIASNTLISPEQVHDIIGKAVTEYSNEIRIINHHLGCDILPKGWSKEQAAIKSYKLLDSEKKVDKWYVFGDNESDKEMCKPFPNVTFIDTKLGASEVTIKYLKNLGLITD